MLIKQQTIQGFLISFYALPADDNIFDSFSEYEDAKETQDKINSGEYVHFLAKITASKNGIELADYYLGSCIYNTFEEFWNIKEDYCSDMIDHVIREAKENITNLLKD